jgi:glycosyltransferase involved in cell wall biosynthesis
MNVSRPFISIVTPSLNQAAYIRDALESVRDQQYPACEHLVLDGGSTDCTQRMLHEATEANSEEAFHWRSHSDNGQSAALNEGFGKARGEIIGWLNADDRYRPDCFAHVVQAFEKYPEIDVFYGDYTFIDEVGGHLAWRREIEFSHFVLKYCHTLYIATTATFFRRRIFDEGYFLRDDLQYAMDVEFFLRLAEAGFRFQHISNTLADFRIHSAGKSAQFADRQRQEHRHVVLHSTPLAGRFESMWMRSVAARLLQIAADALRYSEKFVRGFYFSQASATQHWQEVRAAREL